jgi:hypothetical protein
MKRTIAWAALLVLWSSLTGCVSSSTVRNASPVIAAKPFALDLILVKTTSSEPNLDAEKQTLNDAIASGLRDTHLFKAASGNRDDLGSGSGITVTAEITAIKKISKNHRLWAGAMAGRARIWIHVTVSDLNSGQPMETFDAYAESSGGSALAGTTDEAIARVAESVVGEVLKVNAQTAE